MICRLYEVEILHLDGNKVRHTFNFQLAYNLIKIAANSGTAVYFRSVAHE